MSTPLLRSDLPRGFSFAATRCGIKRSGSDLAILVSEAPASAAAAFTTNLVQAAPVHVSREHLRASRGRMRAIIVNSGNANCCTGQRGFAAAREMGRALAAQLGIEERETLVCSTGVIGVPLATEKIGRALPELVRALRTDPGAFADVARAIMTTDTRPKWAAAQCRIGGKSVRVLGCAKGSGMIHPNMATMLAFLVTDAAASPAVLTSALRRAIGATFNAITVDGDTSTNDSAMILANGQSGTRSVSSGNKRDQAIFDDALRAVCHSLALAIVEDGEGAQRIIEIEVRGAPSERAADRIARAIANSPLVKTAFAGADPNWGRILAAAGRSGARFDPERVDIWLGGILVCRRGMENRFGERRVHKRMLEKRVPLILDLHSGKARARIFTCDLTGEYVRINASYRT